MQRVCKLYKWYGRGKVRYEIFSRLNNLLAYPIRSCGNLGDWEHFFLLRSCKVYDSAVMITPVGVIMDCPSALPQWGL